MSIIERNSFFAYSGKLLVEIVFIRKVRKKAWPKNIVKSQADYFKK